MMMQYESLEAFAEDLPALALPYQDKLVGRDNLFQLVTTDGRVRFVRLRGGLVTVTEHEEQYPACIIRADEKLLLDIICGRTSPMKALLFGGMSVQGDVKPLLRLCSLL